MLTACKVVLEVHPDSYHDINCVIYTRSRVTKTCDIRPREPAHSCNTADYLLPSSKFLAVTVNEDVMMMTTMIEGLYNVVVLTQTDTYMCRK